MYRNRLRHNYDFLYRLFDDHAIHWGIVTKLLCGNKPFLTEVINIGADELHDSRISNLKHIKQIDPSVQTVYIKPPAKRAIKSVIQWADVSFNTEYQTIKMLSDEAQVQDKLHKIIIMIELGDLREGVLGENLIDFFLKVFKLPKIEVIGLGTNLNCLHGVMPSSDKLIQLSLYEQLIEAKTDRKIPWVSGGTSVTLPLLTKNQLPKGINHFRIGETLYFGNNLVTGKPIRGMRANVLKLFAEIIELTEKPKVPMGPMGENVAGEETQIKEEDIGKTSYRAILDIGLLDINPDYLIPDNKQVNLVGASSDMLVADLGKNPRYKIGDFISFKLKYMGALGLMNSNYIDKEVV